MNYVSIIAFTLLMFSFYGWGYAIIRWTVIRDQGNFPFLTVVGIAILIFLGGCLNLLRLAYPTALAALLLSGLAFSCISFLPSAKMWLAAWRTNKLTKPEELKSFLRQILPTVIFIATVGFYAFSLLPTEIFNFHDDFYTYMPRPVRMLQTGTLAGNPYEILGTDSLGAHAFLQGFVLLGLPLEYLQGLEAVFSFALVSLLMIEIGNKFNLHWIHMSFALIVLNVINPQSVNISPIYLGSAFILAIIIASSRLLEQMQQSSSESTPVMEVVLLGFLLAGLIELKNTFLIFALAYCIILFIGLILTSSDKRKVMYIWGLAMLATLVAISPWLAIHSANIFSAMQLAHHYPGIASSNAFTSLKENISGLFSTENLQYGGSLLSYGIIVFMLAMFGTYSFFFAFGIRVFSSQRNYFMVAMSSCAASIITYLFFGAILPAGTAVRYSCPILIATLPFAWMTVSQRVSIQSHPARLLNLPGIKTAILLSMPLLVALLFWNNFIERVERTYYQHMTFSSALPNIYREQTRRSLSINSRQRIRSIQYKTLPSQKILVWISLPMHLDFSRNEIYSIMSISLLNPWLDMPFNGNKKDMVKFLKGQGIRYIMWEKSGGNLEGMYRRWLLDPNGARRKMAERGLYLREMLATIMVGGSFLYDNDGIVLFDLQQVSD